MKKKKKRRPMQWLHDCEGNPGIQESKMARQENMLKKGD